MLGPAFPGPGGREAALQHLSRHSVLGVSLFTRPCSQSLWTLHSQRVSVAKGLPPGFPLRGGRSSGFGSEVPDVPGRWARPGLAESVTAHAFPLLCLDKPLVNSTASHLCLLKRRGQFWGRAGRANRSQGNHGPLYGSAEPAPGPGTPPQPPPRAQKLASRTGKALHLRTTLRRRVNSGGECGAPRGRGGGRHGVRGAWGGVPARGPGFPPDICPPRAPRAPCFQHPPAHTHASVRSSRRRSHAPPLVLLPHTRAKGQGGQGGQPARGTGPTRCSW